MQRHRIFAMLALMLGLGGLPAFAGGGLTIDEAQVSSPGGYPIGIFGSGFGEAQGNSRITILGSPAKVTKWTDSVIEAVVPMKGSGKGILEISVGGQSVSGPFEIYDINPAFLAHPQGLVNLAYKKKFVVSGEHNDWGGNPADFLGLNINHGADLKAGFAAAVNLGSALHEDVWFSLWGGSDFYEGGDIATDYTIDASADSTDGKNGTWNTLETVSGNLRKSRIHQVTLKGQRWVRLSIVKTKTEKARVVEIRVYRKAPKSGSLSASTDTSGNIDCIGIMGDSITFADLGTNGYPPLHELIGSKKHDGTEPMTYIMGLVGANAGGLLGSGPNSVEYALKLTPCMHYFGIAFGTNDSNASGVMAGYKSNLAKGIDMLLAAHKIPLLARIPDTDPDKKGYGTPESKKQAVRIVDELNAEYRLIPGPDFYTPFRQNRKALISDGTHHSSAGGAVERELWADAFYRSGIYAK